MKSAKDGVRHGALTLGDSFGQSIRMKLSVHTRASNRNRRTPRFARLLHMQAGYSGARHPARARKFSQAAHSQRCH